MEKKKKYEVFCCNLKSHIRGKKNYTRLDHTGKQRFLLKIPETLRQVIHARGIIYPLPLSHSYKILKVPNSHKSTDPYLVSIRPVLLKSAAVCFVVLFAYFWF